jgi:hypothetical protein
MQKAEQHNNPQRICMAGAQHALRESAKERTMEWINGTPEGNRIEMALLEGRIDGVQGAIGELEDYLKSLEKQLAALTARKRKK